MTTYDPAKVEAFCHKHFVNDPEAVFYFFAFLEGGSLVPVRTLHQRLEFDRLSPWEQVNVIYTLSDYATILTKTARRRYTDAARKADDRQVLIDMGAIVGP